MDQTQGISGRMRPEAVYRRILSASRLRLVATGLVWQLGPRFSRSRWFIDGQLPCQKRVVGTSWQLLISGREREVHMEPQNGSWM